MANVERLIELRRVIEESTDYDHGDTDKCAAGHACFRTSYRVAEEECGGRMHKAAELLGLTPQERDDLFLFNIHRCLIGLPAFGFGLHQGEKAKQIALTQIDILIDHHSENNETVHEPPLPLPARQRKTGQAPAACQGSGTGGRHTQGHG